MNFLKEFFAYGIGNVISSFFKGFPGCVGLSRCIVFDAVGGKSQFSGFFSGGLILIVLLFLGNRFFTNLIFLN